MLVYIAKQTIRLYNKHNINFNLIYFLTFFYIADPVLKIQFLTYNLELHGGRTYLQTTRPGERFL